MAGVNFGHVYMGQSGHEDVWNKQCGQHEDTKMLRFKKDDKNNKT